MFNILFMWHLKRIIVYSIKINGTTKLLILYLYSYSIYVYLERLLNFTSVLLIIYKLFHFFYSIIMSASFYVLIIRVILGIVFCPTVHKFFRGFILWVCNSKSWRFFTLWTDVHGCTSYLALNILRYRDGKLENNETHIMSRDLITIYQANISSGYSYALSRR